MSDEKDKKEDQAPKITPLEWIVAIVSALIFAGIVGVLIWQQVKTDIPSAMMTATVESVTPQHESYLAHVTIKNEGDKTAYRLDCTADLVREGKLVETSMARVEYVPPHSTKKVGFYFKQNTRTGDVRIHFGGFEER